MSIRATYGLPVSSRRAHGEARPLRVACKRRHASREHKPTVQRRPAAERGRCRDRFHPKDGMSRDLLSSNAEDPRRYQTVELEWFGPAVRMSRALGVTRDQKERRPGEQRGVSSP
jgi:hypothetical protein